MNNIEIATLFERMAALMSIRGDNFHRTNAYRRGAETLRDLSEPVSELVSSADKPINALTALPAIGKTLAAKIVELLETGKLSAWEKLSAEMPESLLDLLRIEGVGPKRVGEMHRTLGVTNLDELRTAIEEGKVAELPKMGEKSAAKMLHNLNALLERGDDRTPIGDAYPLAHTILDQLRQLDGVEKWAVGGSLRRMRETIGDIDLLIGIGDDVDPMPIMDHFVGLPLVASVEGHGTTKSSVFWQTGIKIDLRVLPSKHWGTLLSYFTGSQAHNVKLRELALKQGLSLNEYSFTPTDGGDDIICTSEEEVYKTLNLPYIAPTLRENRGEVEAAQEGRLPELINKADIVADLHMHSTWSDGKHTILQMAQDAKARGLQYIVITDHSRSLGIANGLSIERLWEQRKEIEAARTEFDDDFHIFHGTEMEIKADATLDYPDDVMAELDFVIASLHSGLKQPRAQVMERIMCAIDNRHVDMIAHPTGRLVGRRDGADLDMTQIIFAASSSGTILEINAHPSRLDLNDIDARRAGAMGVKLAINCDAHHIEHFDLLHYGVATAQRGWISAENVVNTWPVKKFRAFINRNS